MQFWARKWKVHITFTQFDPVTASWPSTGQYHTRYCQWPNPLTLSIFPQIWLPLLYTCAHKDVCVSTHVHLVLLSECILWMDGTATFCDGMQILRNRQEFSWELWPSDITDFKPCQALYPSEHSPVCYSHLYKVQFSLLPPNSAEHPPYGPNIQKHECMGAITIQTTTACYFLICPSTYYSTRVSSPCPSATDRSRMWNSKSEATSQHDEHLEVLLGEEKQSSYLVAPLTGPVGGFLSVSSNNVVGFFSLQKSILGPCNLWCNDKIPCVTKWDEVEDIFPHGLLKEDDLSVATTSPTALCL